MRYSAACIEAIGYELPKHAVTLAEIEARLSPLYDRLLLPYGRLETMSGIRERRFRDDGMNPSDAAALAGRKALEQAGVLGQEIECILNCSVSRDFLEPATASVVHERLKISPKATLFDISDACLGMLNGTVVLDNMIKLGQITRGLLVAGENGKPLVETTIRQLLAEPAMTRKKFKDAFASLTIGSGAATSTARLRCEGLRWAYRFTSPLVGCRRRAAIVLSDAPLNQFNTAFEWVLRVVSGQRNRLKATLAVLMIHPRNEWAACWQPIR